MCRKIIYLSKQDLHLIFKFQIFNSSKSQPNKKTGTVPPTTYHQFHRRLQGSDKPHRVLHCKWKKQHNNAWMSEENVYRDERSESEEVCYLRERLERLREPEALAALRSRSMDRDQIGDWEVRTEKVYRLGIKFQIMWCDVWTNWKNLKSIINVRLLNVFFFKCETKLSFYYL